MRGGVAVKSTGNGRNAGNVAFKEFEDRTIIEISEYSGLRLISVSDIALMWLASGQSESCTFGFSSEELEQALL